MHPQIEAPTDPIAADLKAKVEPYEEPEPDIAHLLAVPMRAEAILGTLRMKVGAISVLQVGSILRTSRPAGEPLDLTVNSALVAAAEVCPQGQKLGLRIVELHSNV